MTEDREVEPDADVNRLMVAVQVQPGPDGKKWIGIHAGTMWTSSVFLVSAELAEDFVDGLSKQVKGAVRDIKRAESGLVTATHIPEKLLHKG